MIICSLSLVIGEDGDIGEPGSDFLVVQVVEVEEEVVVVVVVFISVFSFTFGQSIGSLDVAILPIGEVGIVVSVVFLVVVVAEPVEVVMVVEEEEVSTVMTIDEVWHLKGRCVRYKC